MKTEAEELGRKLIDLTISNALDGAGVTGSGRAALAQKLQAEAAIWGGEVVLLDGGDPPIPRYDVGGRQTVEQRLAELREDPSMAPHFSTTGTHSTSSTSDSSGLSFGAKLIDGVVYIPRDLPANQYQRLKEIAKARDCDYSVMPASTTPRRSLSDRDIEKMGVLDARLGTFTVTTQQMADLGNAREAVRQYCHARQLRLQTVVPPRPAE
jgi:hypothetical protein